MKNIALPTKAGPITFPVEGCSGQEATRTATKIHFWHRYFQDTVVILEEGILSHLRFPL